VRPDDDFVGSIEFLSDERETGIPICNDSTGSMRQGLVDDYRSAFATVHVDAISVKEGSLQQRKIDLIQENLRAFESFLE
jgi:hypothetical protein